MADEFPQIVVAEAEPSKRSSPRTGFLPQFSLLQLLLIVVIIALSSAYYSKTVETKRQLEEQKRYIPERV